MNGPELLAQEAQRWLRFATEDLDAAQRMLADRSSAPRHVCWHAQQAAERALKAALVLEGIDFPFTHDLNALRNLLPDSWSVRADRLGCPGQISRRVAHSGEYGASMEQIHLWIVSGLVVVGLLAVTSGAIGKLKALTKALPFVAVGASLFAVAVGVSAGTDLSIIGGAALGIYILVLWRSCIPK